MSKLLAFDTETGGLNPKKNPILTAYFAIVGEDFVVLDELEMKIAPSEPYSLVEDGALKANGIKMSEHLADPNTISREEAANKLREFLIKHKGKGRFGMPLPLGHNIGFDIRMVTEQLIPIDEWEKLAGYANRDTKVVSDFLKDCGLLPSEIGKLESLVKHFDIPRLQLHTAKDDVLMTIEVYRRLQEMVKSGGRQGSGLSVDILDMLEK